MLIEYQSSVDYSMPLRFFNYTNLLYQRRYRDHRWRKDDTGVPAGRRDEGRDIATRGRGLASTGAAAGGAVRIRACRAVPA